MRCCFLLALLLCVSLLKAQKTFVSGPKELHIKKAVGKINIDGILDDADWQNAESANSFIQNFPYDTSLSASKTEAFITYNENMIYVAAVCYDSLPGDYIVTSLKRDWSYPINDAFVVTFDPFDDKTNGVSFGVNPYGAQREGLISYGGTQGVTTDWDNKWYAEVKRDKDKWVVEMAIPFKSIRYKDNVEFWGLNFSRNDLKRNENSCWSVVPRNFNISTLGFCGKMFWDAPPPKAKNNVALIPYLTGGVNQNFVTKGSLQNTYNGGLDAKIAVSSSLNLDVTVNPDFSQVEVDRQVTNLTRFSLFFPERRYFFLENSDLFARFGFMQIRPFFSRQIGLRNGTIIPIIAGVRLSGKINKNWRIGIMNVQTARSEILNYNAQNYTVMAASRQVFGKSNISAIFVNRQAYANKTFIKNDYNRLLGLDYNLLSKNNLWQGKLFYHYALLDFKAKDNYSQAVWIGRSTRHLSLGWNHEYVGENFIAETGFTPRLYNYDAATKSIKRVAYWRFEDYFSYKFYPNSKLINNHGPGVYYSLYTNKKFQSNDEQVQVNYNVNFQNQGFTKIEMNRFNTKLYFATDITQSGNVPLNPGNYEYFSVKAQYKSSPIKKFNYFFAFETGSFYVGKKRSYSTELSYRIQPFGVFTLNYTRDEIDMPQGFKNVAFDLISPRIDLALTRSLFITTFVQYNKQLNNVNLNTRLQWRFRPMSDLYIVYSDNYYATDLGVKNRAVVVKFIYWFAL